MGICFVMWERMRCGGSLLYPRSVAATDAVRAGPGPDRAEAVLRRV